ncbi:hypothetical protein XSP_002188 [Xanthomonas euroxanthea]|uniref:Uncharacterized protein n=1 Tax=Xanthomonas euroxanthea TaxID=2259622 RepID=A0A8E4G641_9XANT|nr:hypothetical protein [Xanthomonas euroxanthea]CAD1792139.1 hypothetical protein XSP_002188 [Xanthomonas euroxanthea]SYZ56263.1 hypothetical protein CPBF367_29540 [Xanthomonas arboricola pv. juglandis]
MIEDPEQVVEPELERVIAVAYGGFPEPLKITWAPLRGSPTVHHFDTVRVSATNLICALPSARFTTPILPGLNTTRAGQE